MKTLTQHNDRTGVTNRVTVVGAAGSIGETLCSRLSHSHEILAVTGVETRASAGDPEGRVKWQYCDLFSLTDMTRVLEGSQYAIFLAHSGLPNSRLQQANSGDMDLLMAENFARAADLNRLQHIFCMRSLLPPEQVMYAAQNRHHQIGEILGSCKTPLTVICTGLVMEPGSAIVRLIGNLVRYSRFVPVPDWSLHRMQPIATADLVRAFTYCLRDPSRFTGSFDIGGPDVLDWREFLEKASELSGGRPRFFHTTHLSPSLYARWLRGVRPGAHSEALQLFVENLQFDTVVRDNPLQQRLGPDLLPALSALDRDGESDDVRRTVHFRHSLIHRHDEQVRAANTVRSIQRVKLPPGRDAAWLSRRYFNWLASYLHPLVQCRELEGPSYCLRVTGLQVCLLRLEFRPERSDAERQIYIITGGLLSSRARNQRGRMEFRRVLGGSAAMIAIHDFAPALPWHFYLATQAALHQFIMGAFQGYLENRSE